MGVLAERGMSAPPEVVFSTATDPDRIDAWLPAPLRVAGAAPASRSDDELKARWDGPDGPAELRVEAADAGGARVRLELPAGSADGLADESLANLEREVAENLTAG
ncbi:hypothetical protein [Micromonospora sp. WMMD987]|uniref:hypothetical protein n=1 Tax=Micromonospora sp. WMMD987 TaxID=3016089 RepID=UPI00249A301F|nr:hypothetical protein [Micromonospora sp. WMMD987]WFE94407.1 hypothetical protein O7612_24130 [Micromonospora sp. WMMD987]